MKDAIWLAVALLSTGATSSAWGRPADQVYQQTTKSYQVELDIDPALKRFASVYLDFRDSTLRDFNRFENQADQFHGIAGGAASVTKVSYDLVIATPHLIGVVGRRQVALPGAPPSNSVSGYLIDRASGQHLSAASLVKPGVDFAPLDAALRYAVSQAKLKRHNGDPPPEPPESAPLTWGERDLDTRGHFKPIGDVTLAPGNEAGKAAGLQVLLSPYQVRTYSDGAYRATVSLDVFRDAPKPEYRGDFAGVPVLVPDDPLAAP